MGLAACKPVTGPDTSLAPLAHGTMAKLQPPAAPASYPDAAFVDGAGKPVKLSDFNTGKVPAPELGDKDIVYVTPSKLKSVFVNGANIVAAAASSLVYRVP